MAAEPLLLFIQNPELWRCQAADTAACCPGLLCRNHNMWNTIICSSPSSKIATQIKLRRNCKNALNHLVHFYDQICALYILIFNSMNIWFVRAYDLCALALTSNQPRTKTSRNNLLRSFKHIWRMCYSKIITGSLSGYRKPNSVTPAQMLALWYVSRLHLSPPAHEDMQAYKNSMNHCSYCDTHTIYICGVVQDVPSCFEWRVRSLKQIEIKVRSPSSAAWPPNQNTAPATF